MKNIMSKTNIPVLVILTALISCTKAPVKTENTLLGHWQVTSIEGKSIIAQTNVSLVFNQENKLSGSASCNNILSSYTRQNNSITVGAVITTRKMCPPKLMSQESKVLVSLKKIRRLELIKDQLTLLDQSGNIQLQANKIMINQ